MLIKIYTDSPSEENIRLIAKTIKNGGVVIIPTDSVYTFTCDIYNPKAIEKVARLKKLKVQKADFSFLFNKLSTVAEYTHPFGNDVFKLMKKNLPGPFTFILEANNKIPKLFKNKKKTLGIRIPDNNIVHEIIKEVGNPILSSSVIDEDDIVEYTTDPSLIEEMYKNIVDFVVDGGYGNNEASTIVNCTSGEIEIIREGVKKIRY